jgi:hypothetical protein
MSTCQSTATFSSQIFVNNLSVSPDHVTDLCEGHQKFVRTFTNGNTVQEKRGWEKVVGDIMSHVVSFKCFMVLNVLVILYINELAHFSLYYRESVGSFNNLKTCELKDLVRDIV